MTWFEPLTLHGVNCTLVPLSHAHYDDLVEAVNDGELWNLWYTLVPKPDEIKNEIDRRLNFQVLGSMLPFSVVDNKTMKVIGMTTFLNSDPENCRLEIGGTWYRRSVQRTGLNTCSKLLLLTHAFESLNCIAVEFRTHFFNNKSRKGIERLGAKLDGILRNHIIMPVNTIRDTCVYSIMVSEWPTVKINLIWLISKY